MLEISTVKFFCYQKLVKVQQIRETRVHFQTPNHAKFHRTQPNDGTPEAEVHQSWLWCT